MKDLCVGEKYLKDGIEKIKYYKIGVKWEKNGKEYQKIFHMPGVLIYVFDQQPKEAKPAEQIEAKGWDEGK